ncbi:MAG: type IV secretion system DNA-binding domain-containing protein [bacterium]|nr:type IV secretion system DNA-binding domain-containing protein [bacterium]
MENLIFWSIGILIIFIFSFFYFLIGKSIQKKQFKKSLNYSLFSIRIPQRKLDSQKDARKEEKEWIARMEQFFSSLTFLKKPKLLNPGQWLTFEIAKVKKEIRFFVASPQEIKEQIEKHIYSFFPEAEIAELPQDYNIFSSEEMTIGGILGLKKPFILPIKTYLQMEADPISNITHALTKLSDGEEAIIQLVIQPDTKKWRERAGDILKKAEKGDSFKKAYSGTSLWSKFFTTILPEKKESPKNEEKKQEEMKMPDKELVECLTSKLSKDAYLTSIRIIVSLPAAKKENGEIILDQIVGSFEQFSTPKLNGFYLIKEKGRALKELAFKISFRIPQNKFNSIFSIEELSSLFHFATSFAATPQVERLDAKKAAPPTNLPTEGLLLGFNDFRGQKTDVRIKDDDRRRHLYVIGQTGTGKSAFLSNLIEQDVKNGNGVGVLDPHGDLIDDILGKIPKERVKDVVLFNPGNLERSVGLNMLEYSPEFPEQKTFIVNELIKIFDKLYDLRQTGGPMFEQYTRNALMLLMDDTSETYTLMEVPKVMADSEFRHRLLAKCKNILVKEFWEKQAEKAGGEASLVNMVPYITSKFDTFISNDYMRPIIGQTKSTFNFREIIDSGKIFLVNLSKGRLGEMNSSLLGLIITGKLAMAAFSRIDTPEKERKDFYLYLDEFQNFATDTISTILSEARKYKLCLNISHQFIGQLPDLIKSSVFGNVGSMISFRVGAEDAEFLQKQFSPVFDAQDLINIENFNAYIRLMIGGHISQPFNIKSYPPSESDKQRAQDIKDYYALTFGRDAKIIEQEIEERRKMM